MKKILQVYLMMLLSIGVYGQSFDFIKKLTASDGMSGDYFGNSVDVSGNYAVVGVPDGKVNGSTVGVVYVYENVSGVWTQIAKHRCLKFPITSNKYV